MTTHRLTRVAWRDASISPAPTAPVRLAHLGLGNFFRAHQAFYTEHAPDGGSWGYAAFAGRDPALAGALQAQDGLYTLVARGPEADRFEVISGLSEVHLGSDHAGWLACVASPHVAAVTVTVTEAGYCLDGDARLDMSRPDVAADIARLRDSPDAAVSTAPARLLAGLAARRTADAGPVAVVPCDNVARNADLLREALLDMAGAVAESLAEWIDASVSVVSTVVDRITPRSSEADVAAVERSTGWTDRAAVVGEPFSEWVLAGDFPAGRPAWDQAGAQFVDDPAPYERRKLWLLNGAHSLLAYAGSILGHQSVPGAFADERCREWVEQWWTTAGGHLDQPAPVVSAYKASLAERFSNFRLADKLSRVAEDGSQKLPIRVLPVLRAEVAARGDPTSATRILAAWICHLRGAGAPIKDVRANEFAAMCTGSLDDAALKVLAALDAPLGADVRVVAELAEQCRQLESYSRQ